MELQERDKEILKLIYEQQFVTTEQIARYYFKDKNIRRAQERIQELCSVGFLTREKSIFLGRSLLVRLTKNGRRFVKSLSPFDVPNFRKLDTATMEHDSKVTTTRCRLLELWDGYWIPETALKDKYARIPDGILKFNNTENAVAVEVENSIKGKSRMLKIFESWNHAPQSIVLVLYVATQEPIYQFVKKCLLEAPKSRAFGLVRFDELIKEEPKAFTPIGEFELFNRRSF